MERNDIFQYVKGRYGTEPDYPWLKFPSYAVLRHAGSAKWYAALLTIPKSKLGLASDAPADILNLKCDPLCIGSLLDGERFFPAYHMNREHWVSVLLEGDAPQEEIFRLIALSYDLTKAK